MTALSIIEKFIHSIDSTIEVDFNHNFCADISEYKIYIEDYEHPKEDKLIQNFIKERFGIIIDPFLIGVLHEVGHLMTYEEELNELEKKTMQDGFWNDQKESKKIFFEFFTI